MGALEIRVSVFSVIFKDQMLPRFEETRWKFIVTFKKDLKDFNCQKCIHYYIGN